MKNKSPEIHEPKDPLSTGWKSASGIPVTFKEIIDEYEKGNSKTVHIGTDSHDSNKRYTFANVICFIRKNSSKYFFRRHIIPVNKFKDINSRILEEANQSILLASLFSLYVDEDVKLVIHSDSNTKSNFITSRITPVIRSWTISMGFEFRSKPDAWASSSVADRHSK